MNRNNKIDLIPYFSLCLVLSFLMFNNIYLVLIGSLLALFSIKKSSINNLVNKLKNKIDNKSKACKEISHETKKDNHLNRQADPKSIEKEYEDSVLSLVERIEESGYIPSLEREKDSNAA